MQDQVQITAFGYDGNPLQSLMGHGGGGGVRQSHIQGLIWNQTMIFSFFLSCIVVKIS